MRQLWYSFDKQKLFDINGMFILTYAVFLRQSFAHKMITLIGGFHKFPHYPLKMAIPSFILLSLFYHLISLFWAVFVGT